MRSNQPNLGGKILPFDGELSTRDVRSTVCEATTSCACSTSPRTGSPRRRERREPALEHLAMVLLGLVVLIASEDFYRLEQSNLCLHKWECGN